MTNNTDRASPADEADGWTVVAYKGSKPANESAPRTQGGAADHEKTSAPAKKSKTQSRRSRNRARRNANGSDAPAAGSGRADKEAGEEDKGQSALGIPAPAALTYASIATTRSRSPPPCVLRPLNGGKHEVVKWHRLETGGGYEVKSSEWW